MKIFQSKNTKARGRKDIRMQNTELNSRQKKLTNFMVDAWIMKIMTGTRKCDAAFLRINSEWAGELCRHVRDGSPMIGGHSTSPIGATLRPWRRQRWTEKKNTKLHNERISENFPLRLLLRYSELIYVRIRTCHIRLPLAMTAHTTHSSSTLRGILSDRFLKKKNQKKKNGKCVCVFVPMVDECHWTECDE